MVECAAHQGGDVALWLERVPLSHSGKPFARVLAYRDDMPRQPRGLAANQVRLGGHRIAIDVRVYHCDNLTLILGGCIVIRRYTEIVSVCSDVAARVINLSPLYRKYKTASLSGVVPQGVSFNGVSGRGTH